MLDILTPSAAFGHRIWTTNPLTPSRLVDCSSPGTLSWGLGLDSAVHHLEIRTHHSSHCFCSILPDRLAWIPNGEIIRLSPPPFPHFRGADNSLRRSRTDFECTPHHTSKPTPYDVVALGSYPNFSRDLRSIGRHPVGVFASRVSSPLPPHAPSTALVLTYAHREWVELLLRGGTPRPGRSRAPPARSRRLARRFQILSNGTSLEVCVGWSTERGRRSPVFSNCIFFSPVTAAGVLRRIEGACVGGTCQLGWGFPICAMSTVTVFHRHFVQPEDRGCAR